MADMDKKDFAAVIGLMVVGGAVLSTDALGSYQWLGWIPLLGGIGYIVYRLKKT